MSSLRSIGTAVFISVLTGACGTKPEVIRSPRFAASMDSSRHASELFAKGDSTGALKQTQKAYELAAAIEDEDGMGAALLNFSVIYQRINRLDEARAAVDQILSGDGPHFFPRRVAEAALRRAVLAADDGEREKAEALTKRAEEACGADCPMRGKVANLRAQFAIEDGQMKQAVDLAEFALTENRAQGEDEEAANSLRLAANAMIHLGQLPNAVAKLNEALVIDKRIGASRKIFRDLLLLGIAASKGDDFGLAAGYFRRAGSVAHFDNYAAGEVEAEKLIQQK